MGVVPIPGGRNLFYAVIGLLELVGLQELLEGVLGKPEAAQNVAEHVVGVGDGGRQADVSLSVRERVVVAPDVFERMGQKMVSSEVLRGTGQRGFVDRDGKHATALAMAMWRPFVGETAQQPENGVRGIGGDRVFDRLPIGEVFLRIALIVQVSELGGSDGDAAAFALADVCAESVGFITSLMRGRGVPQL